MMTLLDKPKETDSTPDARPGLKMPSRETIVRTGKWGTGSLGLAGVITLLLNIGVFEPHVTEKTNARIDQIEKDFIERTRNLASDSVITELRATDLFLARDIDAKDKAMLKALHASELRLMKAIGDSAKDTARLVVAGLAKQNKNGDAE